MKLLATAMLLRYFSAVVSSPALEGGTTGILPRSPVAASAEDPSLGFYAVFPPVPSCLSNVIMVIYVQSLGMLDKRSLYQDMYGPYVRAIEYYVDGTWCDPRRSSSAGYACYGEQLNRSTVPDGVNIVDRNGGGWMMQRSFIDAVTVPRKVVDHAGYLFMTDDVLLNIGQLSRAVNESGCDVIWRSDTELCEDIQSVKNKHRLFKRFSSEAKDFFKQSDERFQARLTINMGSPSKYCMGTQNDFLYMPTAMAADWARVAQQMTDAGLVFTFAFYTAIFGIARMEDMVVLRSNYLGRAGRSTALLKGAKFEGAQQPYCWRGHAAVGNLLAMHIIHPNKLSSVTARNFAQTLNPPGAYLALNSSSPSNVNSSNSSNSTVSDQLGSETGPSTFWCSE